MNPDSVVMLGSPEFARISLRETPQGGAIATPPSISPEDLLLQRQAIILFIHGYNVGEEAALAAYGAMRRHLGSPWADMTAGLIWPGDSAASEPGRPEGWAARFLRPLTYPHQPARARQAAEIVMETIRDAVENRQKSPRRNSEAPPPFDLHLVAHSMGCRLALELIALLRARFGSGLRLRLLVLMAAAVPLYLIQDGKPLAGAFRQAERLRNYRSRRDGVLKLAFRVGQLLERPFPYGWGIATRGALGRLGDSSGTPAIDVETEHGHSDYWTDGVIARDIAAELAALQPELAPARKKPARPARDLEGRKMGGRRLSRAP